MPGHVTILDMNFKKTWQTRHPSWVLSLCKVWTRTIVFPELWLLSVVESNKGARWPSWILPEILCDQGPCFTKRVWASILHSSSWIRVPCICRHCLIGIYKEFTKILVKRAPEYSSSCGTGSWCISYKLVHTSLRSYRWLYVEMYGHTDREGFL